jgi:hypothetical protein
MQDSKRGVERSTRLAQSNQIIKLLRQNMPKKKCKGKGWWLLVIQAVVGKLLLKSNCVTLLPLHYKETGHFESVTHFSL